MSFQSMDTNLTVVQAGMSELGLNELKDAIYQSHFIKKHYDFYQWQQQSVSRFIPHEILIAGWGNFSKNNLQFDISSSIAEVHTQQFSNGCNEIQPLMSLLFKKWEANGDKWFFNEEFKISELNLDFSAEDKIMNELSSSISVLVYGFRDKRSDTEVLYAFFNSRTHVKTHTSVLGMIMPHLDAALRRVECRPKNKESVVKIPTMMSIISERESAVLNLVVQGKTNIEIAETLFISVNTVKNHLKNIYKKMAVSSRTEAVAKYLKFAESEKVFEDNNIHHLSVNAN